MTTLWRIHVCMWPCAIYVINLCAILFSVCMCEQKLTAIVSLDRLQCYVLPLNFTFVKPLREFYELIKNIAVCACTALFIICYNLGLVSNEHNLKSTSWFRSYYSDIICNNLQKWLSYVFLHFASGKFCLSLSSPSISPLFSSTFPSFLSEHQIQSMWGQGYYPWTIKKKFNARSGVFWQHTWGSPSFHFGEQIP